MAQADGVVANGTGSAVRTDINGQYAALWSNHSGSTEPSSGKVAYQTWADTNTGYLKIRNAANNAWVQLFKLDGTDLANICRLTGSTNNTIATVTGAHAIQGEANLTFDGSLLKLQADSGEFRVEAANGVDAFSVDSDNGFTYIGGQTKIGTTTGGSAYADNLTIEDSTHCGITLRSGTTSDGSIFFSDATSGAAEYDGYIQYGQSGRGLTFGTATLPRVLIDSSGNVKINDGDLVIGTAGHGVDFSAQTVSSVYGVTPATSSGDETLDHYEKGTWSPRLLFSNNLSTDMSYTSRSGQYIRIGDIVHASGFMNLSSINSTTGNARIYGLPYNPSQDAVGSIMGDGYTFTGASLFIVAWPTTVYMDIGIQTGGAGSLGGWGHLTQAGFAQASGGRYFSITYKCA